MLQLIRDSRRFFIAATAAGILLRLIFIFRFHGVTTDSFIYGDIAKNWLQHGIYGISSDGGALPTYIRLPGYPAFLAAIFAIFGVEHYGAAVVVQMFVDIGTCFMIAGITRRVVDSRASKAAFLLAAICPFTANYAACALTETLEIFFTALALNFTLVAMDSARIGNVRACIGCGVATAAAILIRPDGGILLAAILLFLAFHWFREYRHQSAGKPFARAVLIVGLVSVAPLVPWTLRNLRTMHTFQPLAPRYANEEDEFVPTGFNRWVKTWIADYASVEEIYWPVPGDLVNPTRLPNRAFDSPEQKEETLNLMNQYNAALFISPALDAKFAALAATRIHADPLRYYVWLPALRIADMWLRPRTGTLPSDSRWWEFNDDPKWSAMAVGMGLVGIAYVCLGLLGFFRGNHFHHAGLLVTFVVLRSLFLGTLENPEPRYTLECFPVVIVFAAALFQGNRRNSEELTQRRIGHPKSGANMFGQ